MMKPQAERLILCSTTHLPPAALSSGAQNPGPVLSSVSMGQVPRKGWKISFCLACPQPLAMPRNLHMYQPTCHITMDKKQPIFRMKFLLHIHMSVQAQNLPSCTPDLTATTSGTSQLNPPANNPMLHLSNHSMDILTTPALIIQQYQGPFPTVQVN